MWVHWYMYISIGHATCVYRWNATFAASASRSAGISQKKRKKKITLMFRVARAECDPIYRRSVFGLAAHSLLCAAICFWPIYCQLHRLHVRVLAAWASWLVRLGERYQPTCSACWFVFSLFPIFLFFCFFFFFLIKLKIIRAYFFFSILVASILKFTIVMHSKILLF